jgi:hypothetical protein
MKHKPHPPEPKFTLWVPTLIALPLCGIWLILSGFV